MRGHHYLSSAPWALCAALAAAGTNPARAQDESGGESLPSSGEIVVFGERTAPIFAGIFAEDEIDEDAIASYGLDTVGQLLTQLGTELATDDNGPVVLINGRPATGVNDIADLPTEAVSKVQILPRAAAARLGSSASRRVINVVIKPDLVQITPSARATAATRGGGFSVDGDLNLLKLRNTNRRSLVLKASHADPLLEAERGLLPLTDFPFARTGNVLGAGGPTSEISPTFSALVGRPVIVAGIPADNRTPSLAAFAALAGQPNPDASGAFRSLVNRSEAYSANASVSERIGARSSLFLNTRVDFGVSRALRGFTPATLVLPASSPVSPFDRDVGLALLVGNPLRARQQASGIDLAAALNTQVGRFALNARTTVNRRITSVDSERARDVAALRTGVANGAINPFAPFDPVLLGPLQTDRARSRSNLASAQVSLNGPLATLPAGPLTLTLTARARSERFSSTFDGLTSVSRTFGRDEIGGQGNLSLPLVSAAEKRRTSLTLDVGGQVRRIGAVGTLADASTSLTGLIGRTLSVTAAWTQVEIAPPAGIVNDPVIVNDTFRAYDFVRRETVVVRSISGGNPDLPAQRQRTLSLDATLRPLADYDFALTAQYQRVRSRDVFAALPPVSAAIQAAFPDRFVRDPNGVLIQVDARPVTFARDASEQLSWGFKFQRTFGGAAIGETDDAAPAITKGRGVRINLDARHTWTLQSIRQARPGLPVIDLLAGGAIGYGGGDIRHVVSLSAGLASRGLGLQSTVQWRGESVLSTGTATLADRLRFAPRSIANLRAFANLGPVTGAAWAKGLRIALSAANLFDSRQRVTDSTGNTPLRYQPFLLDPLGRTVTLELRKAF